MKIHRPCVMLWMAREGTSAEQNAAYDRLHSEVSPPDGRSTAISGEEDELVSVEDKIDGLPLSDLYADVAIAAAKKKGLDQAIFIAAILFRDIDDAPSTSRDISPVIFVGKFEFPFPERGDHIPRDEHGWLGIDSAYCLDEQQKSGEDDGYIGHSYKRAEPVVTANAHHPFFYDHGIRVRDIVLFPGERRRSLTLGKIMTPKDPRKILLSKSMHFSPDEIERMSDAQAWMTVYAEEASRSRFRNLRPTICFTGFTAPEKVLLESIATEKGLRTVHTVPLSLKFLCAGPNAGPAKMERAKAQGCILLSEIEFYAL